MTDRDPEADRSPGLFASIQRLMGTLLDIVRTRAQIVATEIEEERARLLEMAVLGVLTLFFVGVGTMFLTLFVVILYWDTHRLAVLGGVTLLYLGLGASAGIALYRRHKSRPRLFATTLSELAKDQERVAPRP